MIMAFLGAGLLLGPLTGAQAVVITFYTDAEFDAATGALAFESFETASEASATEIEFPDGTFSCSGSTYCPGFFGIWAGFADDGTQSVYFASPDSATFTFASAITAFGIVIGGAGDVANITLTALLSNGDSAIALDDYSGTFDVFGGNRQFFGLISDTPFTSITFTPSNSGDGIFFDAMRYGTSAVDVPEPGTLALLGFGLLGLGFARKRKSL